MFRPAGSDNFRPHRRCRISKSKPKPLYDFFPRNQCEFLVRNADHNLRRKTARTAVRGGGLAEIEPDRQADDDEGSHCVRRSSIWGAHAPSRVGCGASPQRAFKLRDITLSQRQKSSRRRGRRRPHARRARSPELSLTSHRYHALTLDLVRNEKLKILDEGIDLAQIFAPAFFRLQFAFTHENRQIAELMQPLAR